MFCPSLEPVQNFQLRRGRWETLNRPLQFVNHPVGQTKGDRLLRAEPSVLSRFPIDLLPAFPGVPGQDVPQGLPGLEQLAAGLLDRERASPHAPVDQGVVDHHLPVGEDLPLVPRRKEDGPHAGGLAQADGADGTADGLHDIVEGQAAADLPAGAVDVKGDLPFGVLLLEVAQLAAEGIDRLVVDLPHAFQLPVVEHLVHHLEGRVAGGGLPKDPGGLGVDIHFMSPFLDKLFGGRRRSGRKGRRTRSPA